jgi:hypothetical protein
MALPHYSRYSKVRRVVLAGDHPVVQCLTHRVQTRVAAHRPRPSSAHRPPPRLEIVRVEQIFNPRLQEKYLSELQDCAGLCEQSVTHRLEDLVDAPRVQSVEGLDLNEVMLFHGVPVDLVERLAMQGLDPRRAGTNAGKMFGAGSYFADLSSKADIYTTPNDANERCLLVVRTCLGEPSFAREGCPNRTLPDERPDGRGALNSVVALTHSEGGAVEHREFIVYKETQALPQYAVWYRHKAECDCTHCYRKKKVLRVLIWREGDCNEVELNGLHSAWLSDLATSTITDVKQEMAQQTGFAQADQLFHFEGQAVGPGSLEANGIEYGAELELLRAPTKIIVQGVIGGVQGVIGARRIAFKRLPRTVDVHYLKSQIEQKTGIGQTDMDLRQMGESLDRMGESLWNFYGVRYGDVIHIEFRSGDAHDRWAQHAI